MVVRRGKGGNLVQARLTAALLMALLLFARGSGWTCSVITWYTYTPITGGEITSPANDSVWCIESEVGCSISTAYDQDSRYDPNGNPQWTYPSDSLTYIWSAGGGSWANGVNTGQSVTWIAPATPGEYTIMCTISDAAVIPQGETGNRDDADLVRSVTVKVIGGEIVTNDPCGETYGKYLLLCNPAGNSPVKRYYARLTQPSVTSYKWEISSGSGNAHIYGSDNRYTVDLKADAEGDFTLKLTYSIGEVECISYYETAVQKPNQANSSFDCTNSVWFCGTPPNEYMESTRWVYYYVRDQAGRPVPHAYWDETWSPNGCNLFEGDINTNCVGFVGDVIWIYYYRYCQGDNSTLCTGTQSIRVAGWPVSGWFWQHTVSLVDGDSGPYIDHSGCE